MITTPTLTADPLEDVGHVVADACETRWCSLEIVHDGEAIGRVDLDTRRDGTHAVHQWTHYDSGESRDCLDASIAEATRALLVWHGLPVDAGKTCGDCRGYGVEASGRHGEERYCRPCGGTGEMRC